MDQGFENEIPIDDPWVVLDLLYRRRGDNTTRQIDRRFSDTGPFVEIGHHHDFADSTIHRFRVTDCVVDRLLTIRYVSGRPRWGYTDMRELIITESGEYAIQEKREALGFHEHLCAEWWIERQK